MLSLSFALCLSLSLSLSVSLFCSRSLSLSFALCLSLSLSLSVSLFYCLPLTSTYESESERERQRAWQKWKLDITVKTFSFASVSTVYKQYQVMVVAAHSCHNLFVLKYHKYVWKCFQAVCIFCLFVSACGPLDWAQNDLSLFGISAEEKIRIAV